MHFALLALSSLCASTALAAPAAAGSCTAAKKKAAVAAELKTIGSHSMADADAIPLAADATRTFFVTPNELPKVTIPVNVGFSAETVRLELVGLATVLNAAVPAHSVEYIANRNGSMTTDFIQTDQIVLPGVHVREVHTFNDACEIQTIVGYVHGDLACPLNNEGLTGPLLALCTEAAAAGLIGSLQP